MNICEKIFFLQKQAQSYQARRATAQLRYAYRLSEAKQNQFHELIAKAALALWEEYQKQGVITAEAAEARSQEIYPRLRGPPSHRHELDVGIQ